MKVIAIFVCALILGFGSCATTQSGGGASPGGETGGGAAGPAGENLPAVAVPVKPAETRREAFKTKEQVFFANGSAGSYTPGALDEYTAYEWDSAFSNLLRETRCSASGAVLEKIEYAYDGKNLKKKTSLVTDVIQDPRNPSRVQEQEQVRTQVEYEYDQGLLRKETMKNKDGGVISVYEYSYDSQGNRTGRVWKNARGLTVAETAYTYSGGKLMSSETKNAGGSRINSAEYQYNAQGNLVKQESRDANGKTTSVLASVWQNGLEVQDEFLGADNAVQQRETNTYGADGELIQKIIENAQGKSAQIIKYEYAFK
jgi:hypothetical protein